MGIQARRALYLLLVSLLALVRASEAALPPSQIRSLLRLPKLLGYPTSLRPLQWTNSTTSIDFCGIPSTPGRLNVSCDASGSTLVSLLVIGDASTKLSSNFSMESLGNLLLLLPDLESLTLVQLGMWGNIPGKLDHLSHLRLLNLSHNYVSGSLPDRLLSLSPSLQILDLSSNEVSGDLPDWLPSMSNLTDLKLSHNSIGGSLIPQLLLLPRIRSVDLSGNQIAGVLPSNLSLSPSLRSLDVSSNLLTGPPPPSFLATSNSTVVRFDGNCMDTAAQLQFKKSECDAKLGKKQANVAAPPASAAAAATPLLVYSLVLLITQL